MFQAVKFGSEFLVNTTTQDDQLTPTIADLANGGFVITWTDRSGSLDDSSLDAVRAQVFGADGAKVGAEFLVNTQTANRQNEQTVTGLASGGFVVAWTDASQLDNPSGPAIKVQVFGPDGTKAGAEFLASTGTASSQVRPTISSLANGGFVVAWRDYDQTMGDSSGTSIQAQVFGADGTKVGSGFLVNTETANDQLEPAITGLASGGFVITWRDWSATLGDSSDASIKAQMFGADGTKSGSEFLVNTETANVQMQPTVMGLASGGFVVAWLDGSGTLGDASDSIKAQVFGADGSKVGTEFLVNTETAMGQGTPKITGLANGGFVITWQDYSGTLGDSSGSSIKAQVFGADGTKLGSEFLVNTEAANAQVEPTITGLANGGFAVTWADSSVTLGDSSGTSIKAQIFNVINVGTSGDDELTGSSANDVIQGLDGMDELDGGAGEDTLIGGRGDDTYEVDARGDKVVERAGEGTDTVRTVLTQYALGAHVENLIFTDDAAHAGSGNKLANLIIGNSGNDWLDGRGGADTLQGGAGNDRYYVDNVDDQVIEVADAGIDRATASVSYVLAANVENLKLSGPAAIDGTGNADRNIMVGNAADNILKGLDGNDRLVGGAGDDTLHGGLGRDELKGGAGADQFVFDTALHRVSNLDRVTDFVSGTDSLVLDKSVFTAFSVVGAISAEAFRSGAGANAAQDADDRLIYNTSNGVLLYDADGSGAGQSVRIAVLGGQPNLVFADILIAG
jgi:Ca2+-binding RTX toxin-like protein